MEPVTIATAGVLAGVASDYAIGKCLDILSGKVVAQWTDFRAKQFVRAFVAAVAQGDNDDVVQQKLNAIANDPVKSAALFDAYRRVVLSASPVLGPRIIALVMARIIAESRQPSVGEEQIMAAARELNDGELVAAAEDWYLNMNNHTPQNKESFGYRIGQPIDHYEYRGGGDEGYDFWYDQGSWAGKLSTLGFMWTKQRVELDHRNEPKLVTDLYWAAVWEQFASLVLEAQDSGTINDKVGDGI